MNPIILKLATDREDKGKTENYTVYGGGGTVNVKNRKGEMVQKNVILGGNGTVYVANDVVKDATELVLITKKEYDSLKKGGKK